MAGAFLRSHGIDIDAEMSRIQFQDADVANKDGDCSGKPRRFKDAVTTLVNVSLPSSPPGQTHTVRIQDGCVSHISGAQISPASSGTHVNGNGALLAPSLCHPHVHLDKAYLLSHPKYSHLQIERGDFQEAMELTGKAKAEFELDDLVERGQRVIDESIEAGVTHMRAFVEVDAGVSFKCLEAGLQLKGTAEEARQCIVQLCAFAQLPLFSSSPGDDDGSIIRELMQKAARTTGISVVGSTPYVETTRDRMERNVEWMVDLSLEHNMHLDFHLDYNLDPNNEPLVWHLIRTLKSKRWHQRTDDRTVVLGHCTRLTLFQAEDWLRLKEEIADLPISFVGLPTSDLFMMRTPEKTRGTLDVPMLISEIGLNACLGINNIGNAFTPHGTCDPLTLACNGIGIYQAGTKQDSEILYESISTRARQAIGFGRQPKIKDEPSRIDVGIMEGDEANFVLFGSEERRWQTRKSVSEAVYFYDRCRGRIGYLGGILTK